MRLFIGAQMRLFIPGIALLVECPARENKIDVEADVMPLDIAAQARRENKLDVEADMMPLDITAQARRLQITRDKIHFYVPATADYTAFKDPDGGVWVVVTSERDK